MMLCCLVKNCQVISLRILWPDLDLIGMTLIWHLVLTVTFFLLVITFSLGFIIFFFLLKTYSSCVRYLSHCLPKVYFMC